MVNAGVTNAEGVRRAKAEVEEDDGMEKARAAEDDADDGFAFEVTTKLDCEVGTELRL